MNKQQIAQAIESYVRGQGNQAGLQGLADILHNKARVSFPGANIRLL